MNSAHTKEKHSPKPHDNVFILLCNSLSAGHKIALHHLKDPESVTNRDKLFTNNYVFDLWKKTKEETGIRFTLTGVKLSKCVLLCFFTDTLTINSLKERLDQFKVKVKLASFLLLLY